MLTAASPFITEFWAFVYRGFPALYNFIGPLYRYQGHYIQGSVKTPRPTTRLSKDIGPCSVVNNGDHWCRTPLCRHLILASSFFPVLRSGAFRGFYLDAPQLLTVATRGGVTYDPVDLHSKRLDSPAATGFPGSIHGEQFTARVR